MFHCHHNRGFTIPELLVTVSILLAIFAFAGINLLNVIPDSSLKEAGSGFMADAKSQQNSAMFGQSTTASPIDYGIRVDSTSYTLFKGQVYSSSDPSNYVVKYPQYVTATTTFSGSIIVFSAVNGEIKNFSSNTNQIIFYGANGRSIVMRFNKLGNVYYVNKV